VKAKVGDFRLPWAVGLVQEHVWNKNILKQMTAFFVANVFLKIPEDYWLKETRVLQKHLTSSDPFMQR
jgi:hypothetical protein